MLSETKTTFFAPQLLINNNVTDISFYERAFGATEHFCLRNDDNSVHVAELNIKGAVFHLHEVTRPCFFSDAGASMQPGHCAGAYLCLLKQKHFSFITLSP